MSEATYIKNNRLTISKKNLNARSIDRLCRCVLGDASGSGLASFILTEKVNEVMNAETFKEKRKLAINLIDYINTGLQRQAHKGERIDYRTWRNGQKTLDGKRIGICPICGEKGELNGPYGSFNGDTVHEISPFFMGSTIHSSCDW